jgi:hypothetical protein
MSGVPVFGRYVGGWLFAPSRFFFKNGRGRQTCQIAAARDLVLGHPMVGRAHEHVWFSWPGGEETTAF